MTVPHKSAQGVRRYRFSVELLEDRSLLSGLAAPSQANAQIEVLEISSAEQGIDVATEIAIERLPVEVVAAVTDRLPGSTLIAAEVETEEGEQFFDLIAAFNGVELELTVSPDGNVIEIEQAVSTTELPQPVLEWLDNNFPGAFIREAGWVTADGEVTFEMLLTTPTQQAFEAVLRVPDAGSPIGSAPDAIDELAPSTSNVLVLDADRFVQGRATDSTMDEALETAAAPGGPEALSHPGRTESLPIVSRSDPTPARRNDDPAPNQSGPDQEAAGSAASASATVADTAEASRMSLASGWETARSAALPPLLASVAQAIPATSLPQLSEALTDVLPLHMTAIQQGLQKFLDEVDSLVERFVPGNDASRLTPRLLFVAAAALAGAERLISEMKKSRTEPVLASEAGRSTWTWILGLSTLTDSHER